MNGEHYSSTSRRSKLIKMKSAVNRRQKKWTGTKELFSPNCQSGNSKRKSNRLSVSTFKNDKHLKKMQNGSSRRNSWEFSMRRFEAWHVWIIIGTLSKKRTASEGKELKPKRSSTTSKWMRSQCTPNRERNKRNSGRIGRNRTSKTFIKTKLIERN